MNDRGLIQQYMLGNLDDADIARLNEKLCTDAKFRSRFADQLVLDCNLRDIASLQQVDVMDVMDSPSRRGRQPLVLWTMILALAASLLFVTGWSLFSSSNDQVATLVSSEEAAWVSDLPTSVGSPLPAGHLQLVSGIATLRFDSGATMILEAPAQLELVSAMRGRLLSGAAVIDVPDSAIGFVIETPDGYAVDYGTRFAVRIDQEDKQTDFEIIEGEIAVHHPQSGEEVRLTGQNKAAMVSEQAIVVVDLEQEQELAKPAASVIRIGTDGRTGSAMRRDQKRHKFITREFLSVKHTDSGKWDHRSFFTFDASEVDLTRVASARLRLNLVPSNRGFASRLPELNRFGVYGMTNREKDDWKVGGTWDESPGPDDGILLGTFEVPRSQQRGSFGIQNVELLDFLKANHDRPVTLILVRETTQIEGVGPGLTHLFASDSHPEAVGPMLELTVDE